MNYKWIALVLTALVATACAPEKPAPPPIRAVHMQQSPRQSFTVNLPQGCEVIEAPTSMDFAILDINCGGVAKVGIYVGNFSDATFGDKSLTLKPDVPGREVVVKAEGPDKRVYGYLWQTAYDWPAQIHVWVTPDARDDAQAQAIAASLRPTVPDKTSEKAATI